MPPDAPLQPAAKKRCPVCRRPADEGMRPFCSARCRDVDLNRWFSDAYVIPAARDEDDDGNDA